MRPRRNHTGILVVLCCLIVGGASALGANPVNGPDQGTPPAGALSPVGRWRTIDDKAHAPRSLVEIRDDNGTLTGKVAEIYDIPGRPSDTTCTKCDGDRKDQPIKGMTVVWGMTPDGAGKWSGGHVLDPETGKTYKANLKLIDGGQRLAVHGYIGISLIGRTQTWERVR